MKAKNILMTLLLVTGAIAAKAAGYPPELALVSQPVMVYNANSITVYYDVENIGDYTYRGSVYLYLSPDEGYYYADEWIKVRPGRIKRIAIDIPAYRIRKGYPFTIVPYYELDDELYSFTTFEYFEPITFFWEGPRNERWVVIHVGPCPRYYNRPGSYRYYYGFRPPMPPPPGHGPATPPPPMDPKHHTYGYHKDHGGYPAHHFNDGHEHSPKPEHGEAPKPNDNGGATVRPKPNAGSMSGGHSSNNAGSNSGSVKPNSPAPNGSNSGRTPSSGSNRPSSNSSNSNVSRPSSNGSSSGTVSRPSSNSGSSRPSGTSNNSSSVRKSNNSVSSSSSGTRSSSSTNTRSSSSSSSSSNSRGSSSGASRR